MFHDRLPVYCETALNTLGTFPAEPVNTLTSFVPALFGLLAMWWLWCAGARDRVVWALAVLTLLTGLGSVAWHAMRTELTLALDVAPGMLYFLTLVFLWFRHLGSVWLGIAAIAGFLAIAAILQPATTPENMPLAFGLLVLIAAGLLAATRMRRPAAFAPALAMVAAGALAAGARAADLHTCGTLDIGTHFLWHVFLGLAAFLGVRFMVRLRGPENAAPSPA